MADEHLPPGLGRLREKVAIVTGADSGIGRATARLFGREGAKVVCVDLRESGMPRIDGLIRDEGGQATFVNADVGSREGCGRMVAAALEHYGGLDILFNNAGDGIRGKIHEQRDEDWHYVLNLNLNSIYYGVRAAMPHFLERGRGNIVNTASSFGLLATERYPSYCATKAAIVNLTRQLAIDYGPEVRVNCICPGATETPRMLGRMAASDDPEQYRTRVSSLNRCMQRLARPEEIACGVLFLASDESSFVTGHALAIDGGQTIDA